MVLDEDGKLWGQPAAEVQESIPLQLRPMTARISKARIFSCM